MRNAILLLLLSASPCYATKYASPKRHDVFSKNEAFVLDVNPETNLHVVFDVKDRTKPLWSVSFRVWHFPILLSNDGKVVATVAWEHVRVQDIGECAAVTFWNKDGKFRTYPLRELCPDPPKTVGPGPVGDVERTWHMGAGSVGDKFSVWTTRYWDYSFRFADGELLERRYFGREPRAEKAKPREPDSVVPDGDLESTVSEDTGWLLGWRGWALVGGGVAVLAAVTIAMLWLRARHR